MSGYNKEYYEKNKEKILRESAIYAEKNKKRIAENAKRRYRLKCEGKYKKQSDTLDN
jgi:hypothetical protein